jgi:hypothetical protein
MLIGRAVFWENCVEDMISFAKQSNEKCVIALIILANLPGENNDATIVSEIDRSKVKRMINFKIKSYFSNNLSILDEFINLLLISVGNEEQNPMKDILIEKALGLIQSMTQFGMNILKDSRLSSNIFKYFKDTNLDSISKVKCVSKSR